MSEEDISTYRLERRYLNFNSVLNIMSISEILTRLGHFSFSHTLLQNGGCVCDVRGLVTKQLASTEINKKIRLKTGQECVVVECQGWSAVCTAGFS